MNQTEHKTIVIGGISGGIGSALAEQLCEAATVWSALPATPQRLIRYVLDILAIETYTCEATDPKRQ